MGLAGLPRLAFFFPWFLPKRSFVGGGRFFMESHYPCRCCALAGVERMRGESCGECFFIFRRLHIYHV